MKVIFTRANVEDNDAVVINDINIIDIMVEDAEATEIVVDEFLNQFSYADAGKVLDKILSKLRINGKIIIVQTDVELLAYHLARGMIDVERFNEIAFPGPCKSMMSLEIIETLIQAIGVKITRKFFNDDIATVEGVRYAVRC
jgi:hypothetical protein